MQASKAISDDLRVIYEEGKKSAVELTETLRKV